MTEQFDSAWWEERYRSHGVHHGASPTPALVAEVAGLAPGRALDAGCGEGADAVWLASQGWQVTGVDISATALGTARSHADAAGAGRIEWVHADLGAWTPSVPFDLVTSSYVHPPGSTADLVTRLAAAVAPGGTLLVVGHQHAEHPASDPHAPIAESQVAVDDLAAVLDPAQWEVVVAEVRHRTTVHDGHPVDLADAVVRARRRP